AALGEAYGADYYADIIGVVSELKDPRAVNALVGAIGTGDMATRGLAALGDAAAPSVIETARSASAGLRHSAMHALSEVANPQLGTTLTPGTAARVRRALLASLSDSSHWARMTAADGLVAFPDPEVRS